MGRYWALSVASFVMRCIGILCWIFSAYALIALVVIDIQRMQNSTNDLNQLAFGLTYLTFQFWAFLGVFIGLGWFAGGQLLNVLMDIEANTRRVAERVDKRQARMAAPPTESVFNREQLPPNRNHQVPVYGQSNYRVQYNQDEEK